MGAILEHYGIDYIPVHGWQSTLCPVHSERQPSFRVNVDEGAFQCMACGVSGGHPAALVSLVEGCGWHEAMEFITKWTGFVPPKTKQHSRRTRPGRRGYVPRYKRRKE